MNEPIVSVNVTTEEMYENYFASMQDIIWSNVRDGITDYKEHIGHLHAILSLAKQDMNEIRQLFVDGYTIFLLGKKLQLLEDGVDEGKNAEIRVYDHNKDLIGVVIHKEIVY